MPNINVVNLRGRVVEVNELDAKKLIAAKTHQEAPKEAKPGDYLKEFDSAVEQPAPKPEPAKEEKPKPKPAPKKKAASKKKK